MKKVEQSIEEKILFEIFLRYRNARYFPTTKFTSGPETLENIIKDICTENKCLNADDETKKYLLNKINDILDSAVSLSPSSTVISFTEKYIEYVLKQLEENEDFLSSLKKRNFS